VMLQMACKASLQGGTCSTSRRLRNRLGCTLCSPKRFDRLLDSLGIAGLLRVDWEDAPFTDNKGTSFLVTDFEDLVSGAAYETFPEVDFNGDE
jgi:hypothetical protein